MAVADLESVAFVEAVALSGSDVEAEVSECGV